MPSVFSEELSQTTTNQQGFDVTATFTEKDQDGNVVGPYDFTNSTLLSSIKKTRKITDPALAVVTVTKVDAANGVLRFTVAESLMEDVPTSPTTGATPWWYWDFNVKEIGAQPVCFFIAPLVVEGGVSPW